MPKEIKNILSNIQTNLKVPYMNAKFVEKENFHLTLKFLGEIDESKIEKIKIILDNISFNSFKAILSKIGVFPSYDYVRVIWVSLEPKNKLKELNKEINECLKNYFKRDKGFEPHITLARVKTLLDKKSFRKRINGLEVPKREFNISEFKLKKSILTRQGPIYQNLKTFKLIKPNF